MFSKKRLAKMHELPQILTLLADAKQQMKSTNIKQWNHQYPNKEIIKTDIRKNRLWLYGYGINAALSIISKNNICYINRIMVRSAYTNYGIAGQMIDDVITSVKSSNTKRIIVNTHHDNLAMQQVLINHGFIETRRLLMAGREEFGDFISYAFSTTIKMVK